MIPINPNLYKVAANPDKLNIISSVVLVTPMISCLPDNDLISVLACDVLPVIASPVKILSTLCLNVGILNNAIKPIIANIKMINSFFHLKILLNLILLNFPLLSPKYSPHAKTVIHIPMPEVLNMIPAESSNARFRLHLFISGANKKINNSGKI